jgi:hypothetical protein
MTPWLRVALCCAVLLGCAGLAHSEQAAPIPTDGLLAYYPFNGNAHDETGQGHPGMVGGATLTEDRFGNPGCAYRFDGVDDEIVIDPPPPSDPQRFAISLWVNLSRALTPAGWQDIADGGVELCDPIIGQDDGYAVRCFQLCMMGPKLLWHRRNEYHSVATDWSLEANHWYHVVAVFDGADHHLFVDGKKEGNSALGILKLSPCEPVRIGSQGDDLVRRRVFLAGSVDDIRFYDRVLTEAEIKALYHEGEDEAG